MPEYPKKPVLDVQNPFYCPSLPARAYIHNLHQDLAANSQLSTLRLPHLRKVASNPFTKLLAHAVHTPGINSNDKGVLDSDSGSDISSSSSSSGSGAADGDGDGDASTTLSGSSSSAPEDFAITGGGLKTESVDNESGSGSEQFHSASSRPRALTTSVIGANGTTTITDSSFISRFGALRDSHLLARPPRKRKELHHHVADSDSDSDIRGPSKLVKSRVGSVQRSFEVKLKRETLNFDLSSSVAQHHHKDDNLDSRDRVNGSSDCSDWLLSLARRRQHSAGASGMSLSLLRLGLHLLETLYTRRTRRNFWRRLNRSLRSLESLWALRILRLWRHTLGTLVR